MKCNIQPSVQHVAYNGFAEVWADALALLDDVPGTACYVDFIVSDEKVEEILHLVDNTMYFQYIEFDTFDYTGFYHINLTDDHGITIDKAEDDNGYIKIEADSVVFIEDDCVEPDLINAIDGKIVVCEFA